MTNPMKFMQLVNQAATYRANHPHAWNAGIHSAQAYFDSCFKKLERKIAAEGMPDLIAPPNLYELPPSSPDQVAPAVQFALNERLPVVLTAMMADGAFKELGFEPTTEALEAMSVSFAMRLDELFRNLVNLNRSVGGLPGMDAPKRSGCLVLLVILSMAALVLALVMLPLRA